LPRVIVTSVAWASMQFWTNSAIAFSGWLCESAMIRIAFQSSPILSLPLSAAFGFDAPWNHVVRAAAHYHHPGDL